MKSFEVVEVMNYRREHGQRGRGVDVIYRESDDSYYTLEGVFIETRAQRNTRMWGDNQHS